MTFLCIDVPRGYGVLSGEQYCLQPWLVHMFENRLAQQSDGLGNLILGDAVVALRKDRVAQNIPQAPIPSTGRTTTLPSTPTV